MLLAVRSENASLFRIGLLSNLPMLGAVFLAFLLQMMVIYLPALNTIFHTQPLPMFDLVVCLALSSSVLFAVEISKWLACHGFIYKGGWQMFRIVPDVSLGQDSGIVNPVFDWANNFNQKIDAFQIACAVHSSRAMDIYFQYFIVHDIQTSQKNPVF